MNKIDRYKILVRYLINQGLASSQKDLGLKLGYTNESAFSQVINCKAPEPKNFISKLKSILPALNESWLEDGTGDMLLTSAANVEQHGDCNNNQQGDGNIYNSSEIISKLLLEMAAQRESHEAAIARKDAQIERLLSLLENK